MWRRRERGKPYSSPHMGQSDPQGKPMAKRVWEDGKSEGSTVMVGIGVQDLPHHESVQTSIWFISRQAVE